VAYLLVELVAALAGDRLAALLAQLRVALGAQLLLADLAALLSGLGDRGVALLVLCHGASPAPTAWGPPEFR
jgi:hypothetical protein